MVHKPKEANTKTSSRDDTVSAYSAAGLPLQEPAFRLVYQVTLYSVQLSITRASTSVKRPVLVIAHTCSMPAHGDREPRKEIRLCHSSVSSVSVVAFR